jgi:hypothetical protein
MADEAIGRVFPSGGPVDPEYAVGRAGDIADVCERLSERIHTMIVGERRIGKTTVCNAACARLEEQGHVLIKVEAPERSTPTDLWQFIIATCNTKSRSAKLSRAAGIARSLIEKVLADQGVPLDLSALEGPPSAAQQRAILSLPLDLAGELGKPVIFYLDEVQRVVEYADGERLLIDLVDLYAGQSAAVVLADGSRERTLNGLLEEPVNFGKLVARRNLSPSIPLDQWRQPLRAHFATVGLSIGDDELEAILAFGNERPYETMTAARYAAFTALRLETSTVDAFVVAEGLKEARAKLADD